MKIIGLAGIARAGKTVGSEAIAKALFEEGFTPHIEHFATPLKKSAALLGFDKGSAYDAQYREYCQKVGGAVRAWDPHWFVRLMQKRLFNIWEDEQSQLDDKDSTWYESVVIIDDVRYQNEIDLIRQSSGRLIFVSASRRKTIDMLADWRQHESENLATAYELGQIPDSTFDYTISNNNGTQESYEKSIAALGVQIATTAREETH